MNWSLYDKEGRRKYLTPAERAAFIRAAFRLGGKDGAFCAVLALCGPRISEVLALTPQHLDDNNLAIVFETLKRRKRGVFRAVPVPRELLDLIDSALAYRTALSDQGNSHKRLWPWCRTTGWKRVHTVAEYAGIPHFLRKPKALRHAFGVHASEERITLGLVKKWLGHAKLETTEIYATPIGRQERALAELTWECARRAWRTAK